MNLKEIKYETVNVNIGEVIYRHLTVNELTRAIEQ